MPKKRSRSRSRDRDDRKTSKKLKKLQEQIDYLTESMTQFMQKMHNEKEYNAPDVMEVLEVDKENIPEQGNIDSDKSPIKSTSDKVEMVVSPEDQESTQTQEWNQEFLEMMGEEIPSTTSIQINDTIQKQWSQWMTKGLKDETRKDLLKKYCETGTLRTAAPKVNLEVVSHLTEIAKKRDQHFTDTQNCVGTSLVSLGAAISMLMENPEDGVDHMQLMKYLWDSGKLLTDIFHQHSVARKSFITPNLDKDIKSTLDATDSDEWLYGVKLNEQVKDAKNIKKASASLKTPDKPTTKKTTNQVNWRGPPGKARQVGYYPRRQFTNVRFKPKPFQTKPAQNPGRTMTQKQNHPTSRK